MDIVFKKTYDVLEILKDFNYDDAKLAFDQELDFLNIKHNLFPKFPHKKSDVEQLIKKIKEWDNRCEMYDNYIVINENDKDIIVKPQLRMSKKPQSMELAQIISVDECFDVLAELYLHKPLLDVKGILEKCSLLYIIPDIVRLFLKACGRPFHIRAKHLALTSEADILPVYPPDHNFKQVLVYIDRNTSFVLLRPLRDGTPEEVAHELFKIFCDFGAPKYLNKLSGEHLKELKEVMQSLEMPSLIPNRHFARRKAHKLYNIKLGVDNMLLEWMNLSGSSNWSMGLHAIQWHLNTNEVCDTYIRSIVVSGKLLSPYHGLLGMQPHTELVEIDFDPNEPPSNPVVEKVTSDCSQCNLPLYKVCKCHYCHVLCHFWCCERTLQETVEMRILINICPSCVEKYRSVEVTVIEV